MSGQDPLRIERVSEHVRMLVMDNAKDRNKLAVPLVDRLRCEFQAFETDDSARVLIVTGVENVFCAGADLKHLAAQSEAGAREYLRAIIDLFNTLDCIAKPTIAAINGAAFGGGMEMALACDFRLMALTAAMGLPESRLGILPGAGGMQRLPHIVGRGRALAIALTGKPVSPQQALDIGLVSHVCGRDELVATAVALANTISTLSLTALGLIKQLVRLAATASPTEMDEASLEAMLACFTTPEFRDGVTAFLTKVGAFSVTAPTS